MAKVIPFSQVFPGYHPRAGKPTHFVEKFWTSLHLAGTLDFQLDMPELEEQIKSFTLKNFVPKNHTIREGHRFKPGDWFSPRIWSGRPYWSPQIIIAPDTLVTNTWDFELKNDEYLLNGKKLDLHGLREVAENDGLSSDDLELWFQKPFTGQIICWNKETSY